MVELLSILQLIVILGVFSYEIHRKSSALFLWGTLTILFAVPHFLSIVWSGGEFSDEVLTRASIYVILFSLIYLMTRIVLLHLSFNNKNKKTKGNLFVLSDLNENTSTSEKRFINIVFAVFITSIFLLIVYTINYFGDLSGASWLGYYNLNKDQGFFNLFRLSQFLYFGSAALLVIFMIQGKKLYSVIMLIFILFYVWLTGNRITILPLIVSTLTFFIIKSKNNKKYWVLGSVVGIMSIYLIYFLRLIRLYGSGAGLFSELDFSEINDLILSMLLNGDGELGLRNAFYYFLSYNNDFPGFGEGSTYKRLLFILIPSFLISGVKPPDFAITMGQAWMNNYSNNNYSMHPTLFGDSYANFGYLGIFVGIFYACFVILIDKLIFISKRQMSAFLYVSTGIMYVIIARGSIYNGIFSFIVTLLIISMLWVLSRIRYKKIK